MSVGFSLLPSMAAIVMSQNPVRELPSSFGEYQRGFTEVRSIRELASGALLVIGRGESVVSLRRLDDEGVTVGRMGGGGPKEYRSPSRLIALSRDSSILTDGSARRWLVLRGEEIVGVIPTDHPVMVRIGWDMVGTDVKGRLVALRGFSVNPSQPGRFSSSAVESDSAVVILARTDATRVDSIARIRGGWVSAPRRIERTVNGQRVSYFLGPLIKSKTEVAVCPDGRIALTDGKTAGIALLSDLGGRWRLSPWIPLAREPIRVTEALKRAVVEREYGPVLGRGLLPVDEFPAWPDFFPEVVHQWTWCPRAGEVVIGRSGPPGARQRIDVVGDEGRSVARFHLPLRSRILGFGRSSLYLAVLDEDDVEHIRRYVWPFPS